MTAITLFSGVGCSSHALANLGHEVIAHEYNPDACDSLRTNGFKVVEGDVREVDFTPHRWAVKVLEGGPPCQPFSQAHDGLGQFDPRDMIPEFIRAVSECLPELFIMEEVQTLTWAKHRAYLDQVIDCLAALGYAVEARVINAADLGAPQARKRLFVVGIRADLERDVTWPTKVERQTTMAEFLGWSYAEALHRNLQVPDPRAHVDSVTWPYLRPAMTVVGSFRPEVMAAPGYRKAGDPPRQATPGSVVVTEAERKALMGLPRGWVVCGSQAARDLQIGNGVVVQVIETLAALNS